MKKARLDGAQETGRVVGCKIWGTNVRSCLVLQVLHDFISVVFLILGEMDPLVGMELLKAARYEIIFVYTICEESLPFRDLYSLSP